MYNVKPLSLEAPEFFPSTVNWISQSNQENSITEQIEKTDLNKSFDWISKPEEPNAQNNEVVQETETDLNKSFEVDSEVASSTSSVVTDNTAAGHEFLLESIVAPIENFNVALVLPKVPKNRLEAFDTLRKHEQYSDVILIAGEIEFPAHKLILSARSSVFSEMFSSNKDLNRIELKNCSSKICDALLDFIYYDIINPEQQFSPDLLAVAKKV